MTIDQIFWGWFIFSIVPYFAINIYASKYSRWDAFGVMVISTFVWFFLALFAPIIIARDIVGIAP